MKRHWIIGLKLTFVTIIFFGVVYPLFITGLAKIIAPNGGKGEVLTKNGEVIGFELIGQKFDEDKYFWGRPSAVDYNAASTGGSNKGPSNPDYLAQVQARIDTFLIRNPGVAKEEIPVDLVTASGSGIDPHISVEAVKIQINRIARARGLDAGKIEQLVQDHIEGAALGLGPSRVHVLRLNIALDEFNR